MEERTLDDLEDGWRALRRGAWSEAKAAFSAAIEHEARAEAFEGLGAAAWWLDDVETTFRSREQAYLLYRERGDNRDAARMATTISWDYITFYHERGPSNGWLQRARRLVDGLDECSEQGWVQLHLGSHALFGQGDPETARKICERAGALARRIQDTDLEMVALSVEGLALITAGQVEAGMARLDEVMTAIIAGELDDWAVMTLASCNLIAACERIRDYGRAAEWCKRLQDYCKRVRFNSLFAVCRTQYAEILLWHGQWQDAEAELQSAKREFETSRPAAIGIPLIRLAKLRVRQGRFDEARTFINGVGQDARSELVLAELALETGDFEDTVDICEKLLRRLPPHNRIDRPTILELLLRALVARNELGRAQEALDQLEQLARDIDTLPLSAAFAFGNGVVARCAKTWDTARQAFEDAADCFRGCGAPYEEGAARLELALVLEAINRRDAALREARAAHLCFYRIGADSRAACALTMIDALMRGARDTTTSAIDLRLSRRERDVLKLVAQGLTNVEIGERLFISEHTVHRHVGNILTKLDVPSRAAAAAHAAAHGLV